MSHEITLEDGGVVINGITVANGKFVGKFEPWHHLGYWNEEGFLPTVGRQMLDPYGRYDTYLHPHVLSGTPIRLPVASIVRDNGEGGLITMGRPVTTGMMSELDWAAMNTDNPERPTRSHKFEIVTVSQAVELFERIVVDETSQPVKVESMGFLGRHGSKGLFMSAQLPSWEIGGSDVKEYFHVFIPNDGSGTLIVFNTSIVVVCMNTLIAGLAEATTVLKVSHFLGANERLATAMGNIYENAVVARSLTRAASTKMIEHPLDNYDMEEIAFKVYHDAQRPDAALLAKSDFSERMTSYRERQVKVEAKREAAVEIFSNRQWHQMAGITPAMEGTAFGGWQSFTFLATHGPGKPDKAWRETIDGDRRRTTVKSFQEIMVRVDPNYDPTQVNPDLALA